MRLCVEQGMTWLGFINLVALVTRVVSCSETHETPTTHLPSLEHQHFLAAGSLQDLPTSTPIASSVTFEPSAGSALAPSMDLSTDEQRTDWAKKHAEDMRWGYKVYRTYYDTTDEQWDTVVRTLREVVLQSLHEDAEYARESYLESCDPDAPVCSTHLDRDPHGVKNKIHFDIVSDRATLENAEDGLVRSLFREYVEGFDEVMKMGGWRWGGFMKLRLPDQESEGMALNQALVLDALSVKSLLDHAIRTLCESKDPDLMSGQEVAECDHDDETQMMPPLILALDGVYDPMTFAPSTSWTEGYNGAYYVLLEELMTDFYSMVCRSANHACE